MHSTQHYRHNTLNAINAKLLKKSNAWKNFTQILHLMRHSSVALEGIDTLRSGNTLAERDCSGLQLKEDIVMGVILDIDETTL